MGKYILLLFFICCFGNIARAVRLDSTSLRITYKDSLITKSGASTINNNVYFENLEKDTLRLIITVVTDEAWKSLSRTVNAALQLAPFERKTIPISLIRSGNATNSLWSTVRLRIHDVNGSDSIDQQFSIKRGLQVKFSANSKGLEELLFKEKERSKELPVVIRNEGNTSMQYHLRWTLNRFNIDDRMTLRLGPGKDTIINYQLHLAHSDIRFLGGDILRLIVKDDSTSMGISFRLDYCGQNISDNPSAYNTFPVTIAVGAMSRNNDVTNLFINVNGVTPISNHSNIAYFYRTKDYIQLNRYQSDIFRIAFNSPHLSMTVGQIQNFNEFSVFGNEARISTGWGKDKAKTNRLSVWGMKAYKNGYYSNDALGTSYAYSLRKLSFEHMLLGSYDSLRMLNAAIFSNRLKLFQKRNLHLNLIAGLGADFHGSSNILDQAKQQLGTSLGYNFSSQIKKLQIYSSILLNTANYPGIYRGLQQIDQSLSLQLNSKFSLTPFYSSNRINNNFGVDTLLNSNRLQFNSERYGIRGSINNKRITLRASAGFFKNTNMAFMPVYNYGDFSFSYRSKGAFQIAVSSQDGIARNEVTGKGDIWFTNSNFNIGSRYFGVGGTYFRSPRTQFLSGETNTYYTESLSLIGSFRFAIKNQLAGNLDYELAQYALNSKITHNALFHLSYQGLKNGTIINLDGSVPLQNMDNDNLTYLAARNYMQLSLAKTFRVPILTKKKFFDMKVRLYIDKNGNNIKDDGELTLDQSMLTINERLFISGDNGTIHYNNTLPGIYQIDLTKVTTSAGYIPVHGFQEKVALEHDIVVDIPFRTGKKITGNVNFVMDNYSNERYTPDNLKIIISDSSGGIIGHAITDEVGNFSYTVVAGVYKVSLNRDAFNEKMMPIQFTYPADLLANESCNIVFEVRQKKREIRILDKNKK